MTQLNILENPDLLEKTLKACRTQEDIFGEQGLLQGRFTSEAQQEMK
jgi:hypothetical protein